MDPEEALSATSVDPGAPSPSDRVIDLTHGEPGGGAFIEVPLNRIRFDRTQPRREIDPESLEELARSMAALGRAAQAITVRRLSASWYQVVAGERRVRAAQRLGWSTLPAVVVDDLDDPLTRLCHQLAENVARSDLTPAELCGAVARLREAGMSAEAIADATGLSRRSVYNYIAVSQRPELVARLEAGEPLRAVLADLAGGRGTPRQRRPRRPATVARRRVEELCRLWADLDEADRRELAGRLRDLLDS